MVFRSSGMRVLFALSMRNIAYGLVKLASTRCISLCSGLRTKTIQGSLCLCHGKFSSRSAWRKTFGSIPAARAISAADVVCEALPRRVLFSSRSAWRKDFGLTPATRAISAADVVRKALPRDLVALPAAFAFSSVGFGSVDLDLASKKPRPLTAASDATTVPKALKFIALSPRRKANDATFLGWLQQRQLRTRGFQCPPRNGHCAALLKTMDAGMTFSRPISDRYFEDYVEYTASALSPSRRMR